MRMNQSGNEQRLSCITMFQHVTSMKGEKQLT